MTIPALPAGRDRTPAGDHEPPYGQGDRSWSLKWSSRAWAPFTAHRCSGALLAPEKRPPYDIQFDHMNSSNGSTCAHRFADLGGRKQASDRAASKLSVDRAAIGPKLPVW